VPGAQYATDVNLAARQRLWNLSPRDRELDTFAWLASQVEGSRVVEIGCGNGRYLERIEGAIGLDLSLGMLDAARSRARGPLLCGDAQHLPFADDAFDTVLAPMMLYHVPDRARAAHEMRRVLRPGGVAIAATNSETTQRELRGLVEEVVGNGWQWKPPSDVEFSMENGAAQLAVAFDVVERHDYEPTVAHVVDADLVTDYVASVADPYEAETGLDWSAVAAECGRRAAAVIAERGSFDIVLRGGAFICR